MFNKWKLAPAALLLPGLALAQLAIQEKGYNIWLIEKPYVGQPALVARMAGVASYKSYQSNATLAFSCNSGSSSVVSAELATDPKPLGFDSDPYEGPDATTGGPISIISGNQPAVTHMVSGFFGSGGPFDTDTPFIFSFAPAKAEMQQWVAQATPGQSLHITVPAGTGNTKLSFEFRWPEDDAPFKRVVMPCINRMADKSKH